MWFKHAIKLVCVNFDQDKVGVFYTTVDYKYVIFIMDSIYLFICSLAEKKMAENNVCVWNKSSPNLENMRLFPHYQVK